ncbi:MAG: copper amine oxidase [Selenomonadaceae bacterium]|nr:copper amine oxidase [Selenomonadaceae bacterium]
MNLTRKICAAALALVTSFAALPVLAKNFEPLPMKRLPVEVEDTGGTLIFSDSPEYVTQNGILYTDVVEGEARVLFYHLNDSGFKKKIAVIVENVSGKANTVEVTRGGFAEPSANYLQVGKDTQLHYMKNNFHGKIKLAKGERKLLHEKMSSTIIDAGQLIHGVYDFHAKGAVRIYVLMCPPYADPLKFVSYAEILPRDEYQLRGTFKNMNRVFKLRRDYNPATDGIGYVLLVDDATDLYKHGVDATDGAEVINAGNYGVNYILNFKTKAPTRYVLSPLGGTYAGAMRFSYGKNSGVIPTPRGRLFFGDKTPPETEDVQKAREDGFAFWTSEMEFCELGSYSGRVSFEFSPPGASNLPVHIILMPTE